MEPVIIPVMPVGEPKVLIAGPVTADMRHAVLIRTVQDAKAREVQSADSVITAGVPVTNAAEQEGKPAESAPAAQPAALIPVMQ